MRLCEIFGSIHAFIVSASRRSSFPRVSRCSSCSCQSRSPPSPACSWDMLSTTIAGYPAPSAAAMASR
jgi:hypothetical protein